MLNGATVPEILDYLDGNLDIPDDGVNSDIEGLDARGGGDPGTLNLYQS